MRKDKSFKLLLTASAYNIRDIITPGHKIKLLVIAKKVQISGCLYKCIPWKDTDFIIKYYWYRLLHLLTIKKWR